MANPKLKEELLRELDRMPAEAQRQVLYLARYLSRAAKGTSIEELRPLAGTLDDESAREMRQAIEEGCEQVDLNGW